jgi:DNA-binding PadR family transcriptional regulator
MRRNRPLSRIAIDALSLIASTRNGWTHGYDLCRRTGIKSGTLYPLLIRLEAQGYLEAEWQPSTEPGRPPRHAYRLTSAGHRFVQAAVDAQNAVSMPIPSERFA